ncbi:thiamine diphosphate-binding protein [Cantharellus anzutake]|uniref:thiamine diphosphate-binding protein n=1 Tax=Cantharellus anzutake TaxID=1750568 RepID=UPI0019069F50|nr:thiamine diphosphate-binding protein [Cantharellus anzutake]KAF8339608.1 thiamine diphosphate-binding protein [Cantharellus anzutake]
MSNPRVVRRKWPDSNCGKPGTVGHVVVLLAHDAAGSSGPLRVPSDPPKTTGSLPGASASALTTKLYFFNAVLERALIPTFRILDGSGNVMEGAEILSDQMDRDLALRIYESMMILPAMDNILYNVQRQGKISFYMTSHGEEATIIGTAAALGPNDEVLGQYREMGIALWRGCPPEEFMAQCFSNEHDHGKGRQMPVHYGSRAYKFHTISSPLATQIPQAAGVAYALKRDPARRGKDCAVCFFGEGAASEGDFHAGLGMASVLGGPLIYVCRNNGFAISTPAVEQYHGDGIASRGPGYGIPTIRVDGNDILAVYNAAKRARELAVAESTTVLIEAMTYRVGHHSTSDDSFAYRARQEVEDWKKIDNPLHRMRKFLELKGWWSEEEEERLKASQKKRVLNAFTHSEKQLKPSLSNLFTDVYDQEPWNLAEQRAELRDLLKKYGDIWEPWRHELQKFRNNGRDV